MSSTNAIAYKRLETVILTDIANIWIFLLLRRKTFFPKQILRTKVLAKIPEATQDL